MESEPQRKRSVQQAQSASPFVQVCDRCRWKKIKCDGARPCSNCRAASFPCESRARLSKQATPRSYVQYLESRVRQLEGKRDNEWTPAESSSRYSPESRQQNGFMSPDLPVGKPNHGLPDWTILRELGTHVVDESGFKRYMGPSSGVAFAAKVLQEVLDRDQPSDPEFFSLFTVDDPFKGNALANADAMLWQVTPTILPERADAYQVLNLFFLFTERVFPILHQPTFRGLVDKLYSEDANSKGCSDLLAQFYFTLSIGYCFDTKRSKDERVHEQIRALQAGCRCYYNTLHARKDGLTRLQTLALYSYALVCLRQRSESMRISAMAVLKSLECGLHHDGHQFSGNPLETQMRRRVFWCVFMLNLFNATLQGLPSALHEADITIAEPSDIDDDYLTPTEVLPSIPARTKIHRFVSSCRLARILSRVIDVLYTHNKRKQASSKIDQMHRLCCEHLLDALDFSFEEVPDDIPDPDSEDPADMATLSSFANEQLLFHYIRWIIHRPGLAFNVAEPQFSMCLQISTDAASAILKTAATYRRTLPYNEVSPAGHPMTIFVASLNPIYRTVLAKTHQKALSPLNYSSEDDRQACQHGLSALAYQTYCRADQIRQKQLHDLMAKVFGDMPSLPEELRASSLGSQSTSEHQSHDQMQQTLMDYREQQLEHFTAHEDLRNFVHDAFSPGWNDGTFGAAYGSGQGF